MPIPVVDKIIIQKTHSRTSLFSVRCVSVEFTRVFVKFSYRCIVTVTVFQNIILTKNNSVVAKHEYAERHGIIRVDDILLMVID